MKPKTCRKILNGVAVAGICIIILSYIPGLPALRKEMINGVTVLLIGDLIFGFLFLRCPHCKKLLNFRWSSQSICHNCGQRLDEEEK